MYPTYTQRCTLLNFKAAILSRVWAQARLFRTSDSKCSYHLSPLPIDIVILSHLVFNHTANILPSFRISLYCPFGQSPRSSLRLIQGEIKWRFNHMSRLE